MTPADLDEWLLTNSARLDARGLTVTRSESWGQASQQGLWFDLEGARAWGRVTLWPYGKADIEIIDAETTRSVKSSPDVALNSDRLDDWLAALLAANVS